MDKDIYVRNEGEHHYFAAKALFSLAAHVNFRPLVRCLAIYSGRYGPISYLLQDFSRLATYDASLRAALPNVWPVVMRIVLDAAESNADPDDNNYHRENALAHILPHPILSIVDREPDASLSNARADWIDPSRLEELVPRWIPLARGIPRCVDAAIDLVRTASPTWQASVGLRWIDGLAHGATRQLAGQCWHLPDWLKSVRSGGHVDSEGHATIQRIVDGLATHGDWRAVGLQTDEE